MTYAWAWVGLLILFSVIGTIIAIAADIVPRRKR